MTAASVSRGASTVREALAAAAEAMAAAGVDTPRLDAEVLLADASGLSRQALAADPGAPLAPPAARTFAQHVRRRLAREPVAYITGTKGFRRIELGVDGRVLVPRPETELLVEVALEIRPQTVLDVGTGSGAVALAVADEIPGATVVATDTSPGALAVARANADRLGLSGRVRFRPGSVPDGDFDLALANLPYVSEADWEALAPEIREWEPREALVSGPDGLAALRAVAGELQAPVVALEVGAGQAAEVARLLGAAGYEEIEARRDLAGIERVVVARRAATGTLASR